MPTKIMVKTSIATPITLGLEMVVLMNKVLEQVSQKQLMIMPKNIHYLKAKTNLKVEIFVKV